MLMDLLKFDFILGYIVSLGVFEWPKLWLRFTFQLPRFFFLKTTIDIIVSETLSQSDERQIREHPFFGDWPMVIEYVL